MERDEIEEIGIDGTGRIYVKPLLKKFPYIYREAIEVHWDNKGNFLYAPSNLKEWSYFDWFRQIIKGAKMQGTDLYITEKTKCINIPDNLKEEIFQIEKCLCNQFIGRLNNFDDVKKRCVELTEKTIKPYLIEISKKPDGWTVLYQCVVCNKYWMKEYPFSESQGGGSPCFYIIETTEPIKLLNEEESWVYQLRRDDEDKKFYDSLIEIGPDTCSHSGCSRKQVKFSTLCKVHHFEMIKKRKVPMGIV